MGYHKSRPGQSSYASSHCMHLVSPSYLSPTSSICLLNNTLLRQPPTPPPTPPPITSNALPRRPLERLLRYHINLIRQRHNNILIAPVLEIIGLNFLLISLNRIGIFSAGQHLLHVPRHDERACGGDDRGLFVVDAGVEAGGSK